MLYVVRPGDTLWAIAQRYGFPVRDLVAANPQVENPARIRPGQTLTLPRPPVQVYVVQPGDTLYEIALRYGVTVQQLRLANPAVVPEQLQPGQRINIPIPTEGPIVRPREGYGYEEMLADLDRLLLRYPFLERGDIGESVMGRRIPVIRIGEGEKEVHYNGAFHAQEWITTPLLMRFLEVYAEAVRRGRPIGQFDIGRLYRGSSLWVVPMVNPDGVELVHHGITPENPYYNLVLRANGGSRSFSAWAANIRGVDLNNQFPAEWQREANRGSRTPSPRDYSGAAPLTEPEARAMADFTRAHDFRLVIAWHTQGEEIYWGFEGYEPSESEQIVALFADASGYTPVRYVQSWAGYKDWFIQDWRRPGFTVEVGRGINPLPITQFDSIWSKSIGILLAGLAV